MYLATNFSCPRCASPAVAHRLPSISDHSLTSTQPQPSLPVHSLPVVLKTYVSKKASSPAPTVCRLFGSLSRYRSPTVDTRYFFPTCVCLRKRQLLAQMKCPAHPSSVRFADMVFLLVT